MGKLARTAQANRMQHAAQMYRVVLSFQERFGLRSGCFAAPMNNEEENDRNNRAIEALEGDDAFDAPLGMAQEEREALAASIGNRLNSTEDTEVFLTVENAQAIRAAFGKLRSQGKIDGATGFRLRRAEGRIRYVADSKIQEDDGVFAYVPKADEASAPGTENN